MTGIETQSYGTDPGLLAALREAWPPAAARAPDGTPEGYAAQDLDGRAVDGAIRLTDRLGVALAADGDGHLVVPVVRSVAHDGTAGWRRAGPGDGLSAFVAGAPMASERAIGVDQTNHSVVVGERAVVKWFRRIGPEPSRAALLLAHLDAVGFGGIPRPLGSLAWRSADGRELVLAQGDAWLAGARDGWEWVLERVARHVAHGRSLCPSDCDPWIGERLGRLTAELHAALRSPSPVIAEPAAPASPADLARWTTAAAATLDEALDLTDGPDGGRLRAVEPAMRDAIRTIASAAAVPLQPVHGDFHIGQVLEWDGGLSVIDFDGNPSLPAEANAIRQPVERDIAQLTTSLDHAGRVVDERTGGRDRPAVEAWIERNRTAVLDAVVVDLDLHAAFEVEQEARELVYAARFLPRWRYAPLATLEARFGR